MSTTTRTHQAQQSPCTVSDVIITSELSTRTPVPLDLGRVNQSLHALSKSVSDRDTEGMLRNLVEVAVDVCRAGTAGLSVLERQPDDSIIFRWDAMGGALSAYKGGSTPRDFSPCGITLDRNCPQLFYRPGRYFTYFQAAQPEIVEGLVLPLFLDYSVPYGTLWIASHDDDRRFNSEDVRVMESLCSFTMAAARILGITARN